MLAPTATTSAETDTTGRDRLNVLDETIVGLGLTGVGKDPLVLQLVSDAAATACQGGPLDGLLPEGVVLADLGAALCDLPGYSGHDGLEVLVAGLLGLGVGEGAVIDGGTVVGLKHSRHLQQGHLHRYFFIIVTKDEDSQDDADCVRSWRNEHIPLRSRLIIKRFYTITGTF